MERHLKKFGRPSLALLLAAVVLLLNLLAASPSLHERFHTDASHAGHQCAVTLFAHGQTDAAVVEVAAVRPVPADEFLPLVSVSFTAAPMAMLPPGRAPPPASVQS